MSTPKTELLAQQFQAAVDATVKVAESVPEGCRLTQLKEGKAHPLWLIGHLSQAMDLIVNQWILAGEGILPAESHPKFAPDILGGVPVTANGDDYPSWDDTVSNYKAIGAKTVELINALADDELDSSLKGDVPEAAREFFGTVGQSLASMLQHDAYHRGQVGMLVALNS